MPRRRPVRRAPVVAPLISSYRHAAVWVRMAIVVVVLAAGASVAIARDGDAARPVSFCETFRRSTTEVSLADLASKDPAVARQAYARFNASLRAVAARAPAAVAGDVAVLVRAFAAVEHDLAAVGFRAPRVDDGTFAVLSTPSFRSASTHVSAYGRTTCGAG
jgi:hypothetical protein